jgi:hypothetical protein
MDSLILSSNMHPIEYLVTPLTPYLLCNHFISTEIHPTSGWKYIGIHLKLKANDLLKNNNYNNIKNGDIIQIQVDLFDFFCNKIFPIIVKNNIKIIIITSQWNLPQITKNNKTDEILNNNHLLFWISQNPIYTNHAKYMAFPYGICHQSVEKYVDFIKSTNYHDKNIKILNQHSSVHPHLPNNHIRKQFDIFGKNSGKSLNYTEYLTNILNSEFVISTSGDRDDCFRHYECIGLNAIPVSNINGGYKEIFGENMVYSTAEEMIHMITNNVINYHYIKPNKNILTIPYLICEINKRLSNLQQSI